MADAAISVEDVSKRFRVYHDRNQTLKATIVRGRRARYEEFWALKEVSFDIERGETFGIIGHNGSGKSTMLKCLAKILRPDEGRIEVRGTASSLLELGAGFHPELTGRENIYLNASILGLSRRQVDERFDEIVDFADLEQFIEMPVKNYSSGMYVRLGFAVAINVDPEILMIDEVLAVGDEVFQRKSAERIAHFRNSNRTVVIVSHGLDQVRSLCDRVAWLDHGKLQMVGPAPEVVDAYTGETVVDRETTAEGVTTRWGSGEARITEVDLLDASGSAARAVRTGDPLTIRIHFVAHERIIDPNFGIAIEHIDGQLMTATNTTRQNQTVKEIDGPGVVDVHIPAVTLAEGTYDLTVAIGERTERNDYDHWHRPIRFDVKRGSAVPVGYLDLGVEFGLDAVRTESRDRS